MTLFNLSFAAADLYPSNKRTTLDANSMQIATTGFSFVMPDGIPETGFNGITGGVCGDGLNLMCAGKNAYNELGIAWACSRMWVG